MAAVDVCAAVAQAQAQYFSQRHDGVKQYAQKFISEEGKQNGLYWSIARRTAQEPARPDGGLRHFGRLQPAA